MNKKYNMTKGSASPMKKRSQLNKQSVISNEKGFRQINKGYKQLDKEYWVSSEQGVSCLK